MKINVLTSDCCGGLISLGKDIRATLAAAVPASFIVRQSYGLSNVCPSMVTSDLNRAA
jgi:hypothetical protein